MQRKINNIRQSTETPWFIDHGYNSGDNIFAGPAVASREVWTRDTTTRRSQRIRVFGPGICVKWRRSLSSISADGRPDFWLSNVPEALLL